MLVIALDPGFGNTKVAMNGQHVVLQSAVARPVEIGLAAAGVRVADRADHVTFDDGHEFVTGPGAWMWGNEAGSMDYSSLAGPERLALLYSAISKLVSPGDLGDVRLVAGLPVPLLQDEPQARVVIDVLRSMKRQHIWYTGQGGCVMDIRAVKYLAQPVGAWADWLYDDELRTRQGASSAETAVLDLGMNTLDLFVVSGGQVRPSFLGGDKVGVRRLLSLINTNGYTPAEADAKLRSGQIKAGRDELNSWLNEVLSVVERTWPNLRRFDAVIPAGGGAALLGNTLHQALESKHARVYWPTDPVGTNVRGLWKYVTTRN